MPEGLPLQVDKNVTQTPLIKVWEGKPRPDRFDGLVIGRATEKLLPKIIGWLQNNGDTVDEKCADEVRIAIRELIRGSRGSDGYQLAKSLDGQGWEPDSELVEILDDVWCIVSDAHNEFSREWARQNSDLIAQIASRFPVGTPVKWKPRYLSERTGKIRQLILDTCEAVISEDNRKDPGFPIVAMENLNEISPS